MWDQRVTCCLAGDYEVYKVEYVIMGMLEQAEAVNSLLSA